MYCKLIALLLVLSVGCNPSSESKDQVKQIDKPEYKEKSDKPKRDVRIAIKVIDGDTLETNDKKKVRLIGIDTPETKHPKKPVEFFGKEATKKLIEGKEVQLEYDVQKTDKYGRVLAYVYVGGIFVNAWLVENGYAKASTYPPNVKYAEKFRELERKAREEKKGLWNK